MSNKRDRDLHSDELGEAARSSTVPRHASATSISEAPLPSDSQDLHALQLLVEQQQLQLQREQQLREQQEREQRELSLQLHQQLYHEQQLRLHHEQRLLHLEEQFRSTYNQLEEARKSLLERIPASHFRFYSSASDKSDPSKVLFQHLDYSLRPIWSPLAWNFLNNIYREQFYDDPLYMPALAEATSFLDLFRTNTPFSQNIRNSEQNWTSSLATAINRLLSRSIPQLECRALSQLVCPHPSQSDLRKAARIDTGVVYSTGTSQSVPFSIEVKMADDTKKGLEQNARYCSSLACLDLPAHFLAILIAFPRPSSRETTSQALDINVQLLVPVDTDTLPSSSTPSSSTSTSSSTPLPPLFFPMNLYHLSQSNPEYYAQNLARLLLSICNTCAKLGTYEMQQVLDYNQHIQLRTALPSPLQHRIPILGEYHGKVIKVYHPPADEDTALWYRRPTLYPLLLPGSEIVVDTYMVQVLTYPWIEGQVCPPILYPHDFLAAARDLQRLYNLGLRAHGDIRLANLVVSGEKALWLDFDYSILETEEPRYYPASWALELRDTVRHKDSRSGEPILRDHDLYSFSKLLLCYKPEGEETTVKWLDLSRALGECGNIEGILELLEGFIAREGACRLQSLMPPNFEPKGTGSPVSER